MCVEKVINEDVKIDVMLCVFSKFSDHISDKNDFNVETVPISVHQTTTLQTLIRCIKCIYLCISCIRELRVCS